jgi:hypothetical protein
MKAEFKNVAGHYINHKVTVVDKEKTQTPIRLTYCNFNTNIDNLQKLPILHPLENLIKIIEFEGLNLIPMFELLKICSNQEAIPADTIDYSIDNGVYFIKVVYMGFYVVLAYDSNDSSFRMIRNDKMVSVNNQLKAFEMLYKWHFNIHNVESISK